MLQRTKTLSLLALAIVLAGLLAASGCTPLRQGAGEHNFYSAGISNINITVAPPLKLAGTGEVWGNVPSDVNLAPYSSLEFAVFADKTDGPVDRYAHTAISRLPGYAWRWIKETWETPQSLSLSKMQQAGKFWTVHMMPVVSDHDWFSEMWLANGRPVPAFWLAKRWSATPDDQTRIIAEYREAAPQCMQTMFRKALQVKSENPLPKGDEIWMACRKEINAFSDRADTIFTLDKMPEVLSEPPLALPLTKPAASPNMKKLAGEAEMIDNDTSNSYSSGLGIGIGDGYYGGGSGSRVGVGFGTGGYGLGFGRGYGSGLGIGFGIGGFR